MTTFNEDRHAGEFILSEANGNRSRENGTVLSGQDLKAGEIIMDNGAGKIVAFVVGTGNTVLGILITKVDATGGDVEAAYIARDAEVVGSDLTYEEESTAGGEQAAANAGLADLGIIVR